MRIKAIIVLATTIAVAAACSPAPGSAEWCKGIQDGSVKPTMEQAMEHGQKCATMMIESLGQ